MRGKRSSSFFRSACLAVGLAVAAAACGGGDDDTSEADEADTTAVGAGGSAPSVDPASGNTAPPDAEYDLGATFTVGMTTLGNTLDPVETPTELVLFRIMSMVYDRLFTIGPTGELKGMLVKDWESSADGLRLTLTLRDDVSFRDGTPLDASVVKANLDRTRQAEGPVVPPRLEPIKAVNVVDKFVVEVVLSDSTPAIPYALAETAGFMMHPELIKSGDPSKEANGSGPYVLKEFTPGERVVVTRDADNYWQRDAAKFARMQFEEILDANALANAMKGGQIDLAQFFPKELPQVENEPGLKVVPFPIGISVDVVLNPDVAPLDDIRVRQAINHAIDRDAITEALYPGSEPKWSDRRSGQPAYNEALEEAYPYDPERAKELLAEAGHPDGIDLGEMLVSASAPAGTDAVVQEQLAQAGISVETVTTDSIEIFSIWAEGKHSVELTFASSGIEAGVGLQQRWERPVLNPAGVTPEYRKMYEAAADSSLSEEERNARYEDLQAYVVEQAWSAPIVWTTYGWTMPENVVGLDPAVSDYSNTIGAWDFRGVGKLAE